MKNKRQVLAGFYVLISIVTFMSLSGCAVEDRRALDRRDDRRDARVENRIDRRADRHYYRDGRWYRHDPRAGEIVVDSLAIGAFVEFLPPQHTTVVIQGAPYYHDGRYYYRQAFTGGYTVVSPPVADQDKRREHR